MKNITAIILCVLLSAIVLISGCGKTANKPVPENTSNSGIQQTSDSEKRIMASNFSNLAMGVNGVQKATVVVSSAATDISQNISTDPNNVSSIVNGTTTVPGSDISGLSSSTGEIANVTSGKMVVMVGLNLNTAAKQEQNRENTIKEEVKTKIMQSDQRVNEVLVTTNPDMIKKLQDVAAGVIQGKPFQSYSQDITELDKSIRTQ